jgi:hypothetical protein
VPVTSSAGAASGGDEGGASVHTVQGELLRRATMSLQISAQRGDDGYWSLRVAWREDGSAWLPENVREFGPLSTDELEDTICSAGCRALGAP